MHTRTLQRHQSSHMGKKVDEEKKSCGRMESTAESTGAGIGTESQFLDQGKCQYTCEICGITFKEKSKLIDHFFGHEKENQCRFSNLLMSVMIVWRNLL